MKQKMLHGVFDTHLHSYPDIAPRKADDIELARMAAEAGMGGFLIKSHAGSSVERAYLVRKMFPGIHVLGGIVLNYPIGGLNPLAVETYVRMGAKEVWMPSLSAQNMFSYMTLHSNREDQIAFQKKLHTVAPAPGLKTAGGYPSLMKKKKYCRKFMKYWKSWLQVRQFSVRGTCP